MSQHLSDILAFLRRFAPLETAASWDNVGLLLGDESQPVERILTCLTVTPESAQEAIEEKAELIVSHHPILFRPVQRLTADDNEGRMLLSLARAGIAVYSPHTAFDNAPEGINALLAKRLELADVCPLKTDEGRRQCKIVVFVPDKDLAAVSDALFAAGAGKIGQYIECSFRLKGTGTFFGSDASNPTIGEKGRREDVEEWRLEAVCPEAMTPRVIQAMRKAHSYEEPAYDVYPLRPEPGAGVGRLGALPTPMPLNELAARVRTTTGALHVQTVGDADRPVRKVAIVCGAGGEFVRVALKQRADVLLTGEARFHDILAAQAGGLGMILPGHYASERPGIEHLADRLGREFPHLKVWASQRERDPLA